jgi:glycine oxidase
MSGMRIGIAGAGLLGRLLAWRLCCLGHSVTLHDPADGPTDKSRAAGWTAAGMLSPSSELEGADLRLAELGWRSLALWADIVDQLPAPVYFRREGSLLLAHRSDLGAARRLMDVLGCKLPASQMPRALAPEELARLEPAVHGPTQGWLVRGEGQIHTIQAMQALADGATARGATWRWRHTARDVSPGRIDGERFDTVFDVRGVGARPDASAPDEAAGLNGRLRGVRGEIIWVHAPGVALGRPLRLLHPRWRVYLVPRPGDIIVIGASEIESEDRSPISVRTLSSLLSSAHSVVPELAEARVVHTETNLRPALPDNLPGLEHTDGLTRINGLFRHGWLIAPAIVQDALRQAGIERQAEIEPPTLANARLEPRGDMSRAAAP